MFSLFKKDPLKKLNKQYEKMMLEARDIQRTGDLKLYAKKIAAAEEVAKQINELKTNRSKGI